MCTVLLRLDPTARWPLQLGAIRDEFVARSWDPPARHWAGPWAGFVGGRDRAAGGTWLAVDPSPGGPSVAALLNGRPREPLATGGRPTRGELVLRLLAGGGVPQGDELHPYDRFHLLWANPEQAVLWTWDGEVLTRRPLRGRHHIVVNAGLDAVVDPLVPHFAPLLAGVRAPGDDAADWGGWPELLVGDHLPGDDDRALLVAKDVDGRAYGSTSGTLVALGRDRTVRCAFTATPADPRSWGAVLPG